MSFVPPRMIPDPIPPELPASPHQRFVPAKMYPDPPYREPTLSRGHGDRPVYVKPKTVEEARRELEVFDQIIAEAFAEIED